MKKTIICAALLALATGRLAGEVALPDIIADGMVLQRGTPVKIWGTSAVGEKVCVSIAGASVETAAGTNGAWMVELPAMESGGPHEITVKGENTIVVKDVLVGEVWLCSGQSNMSHQLKHFAQFPGINEDLEAADNPRLRFYCKQNKQIWVKSSREVALATSGVGYYLGRFLEKELDAPVGIIVAAQGGTNIEGWLPRDVVEASDWGRDMIEARDSEEYKQAKIALDKERKDWEYKRGMWQMSTAVGFEDSGPYPEPPVAPQIIARNSYGIGGLYDGILKPVAPYTIRGFAWYQGEANVGDTNYKNKQNLLVKTWRDVWGQGDLPFFCVQITAGGYKKDFTVLPEFWEQQFESAREIGSGGIVCTIDIGEPTFNIHPPNKPEVGRRLSLIALAKAYGRDDVVWSGPTYKGIKVEGGSMRIQFEHADDGLETSDGNPPAWFEVAGADGKFTPAQAAIDGSEVVVRADAVKKPVAARYSWSQAPGYTAGVAGPTGPVPNLINKAGLPAYPFRTK